MATRTRTTGRKKMARKSAKSTSAKGTARRKSARKASARKTPRKATTRKAQVARVKRVTREVVQQASAAVTAGVETLKDIGGNLMDRVRA